MERNKALQEVIDQLSRNTSHWLEIKKILEEDIRANKELITLIDQRVKENESKISQLN
jgi:hypothetical protein